MVEFSIKIINMNVQSIKSVSQRSSNIEVLRIVAIILVITEHFTNYFGGMEFSDISFCTKLFANIMLTVAICSVDVFLIISGYFSIKSQKRILGKPFTLLFLSVFYVLFELTFGAVFFHNADISRFLRALVPSNYFVNIFCGLYFISPYINKFMLSLSKRGLNRMIIVLLVVLSIWPMFSNIVINNIYGHQDGINPIGFSGSDRGMTLINFAFCYIIGAYIRLTNIRILKCNKIRLCILLLLISFTTLLVMLFPHLRSMVVGVDSYDNILVLFTAVLVFMIFKNLNVKFSNTINQIASTTFGVYLVHIWVLSYFRLAYQRICTEIVTSGGYFVYYFLAIISTYIVSVVFYMTMNMLAKPIRSYWKKTNFYNFDCYID